MEQLCQDLADEHAALDAALADLDEAGWARPTAAAGWTIRDTLVHLAYFDDVGRLAAADPAGFADLRARLVSGAVDVEAEHAHLSGAEVLAWWRRARTGLLDVLRPMDPKDRIEWFGPPMSARSHATARLMETWSHGMDAADAAGHPMAPSDRLRHVAHIGVTTRGWSYVNRGKTPPDVPVRVELRAPSGELWTWGPEDAENVVRAEAFHFCLAVTQRRLASELPIETIGNAAAEWMSIAQAFAGGPTLTDPDRAGLA
jgi:uncharacterized protein (TIGR03084 family)